MVSKPSSPRFEPQFEGQIFSKGQIEHPIPVEIASRNLQGRQGPALSWVDHLLGGDQAAQAVAGRYHPARCLQDLPDHDQIGIPIAVHIAQNTLRYWATDTLDPAQKNAVQRTTPRATRPPRRSPGAAIPPAATLLLPSVESSPLRQRLEDRPDSVVRCLGVGLVASGRGCPAK